MQDFIWTSDIHLDRMNESEYLDFKIYLQDTAPDGFIIAGDIAEAGSVVDFLEDLRYVLDCPIYFVLGNHDFWGGSFGEVKSDIRALVEKHSDLFWLSEDGVISLDEKTALIGHDGWADARFGKISSSGNTVPRDFMRIKDLKGLFRTEYKSFLNKLGDEAAAYIREVLLRAVANYEHIHLVTHVPPFREASLDRSGRICNDEKLPFYSCRIMGEVLLEIMSEHPDCHLTVLCGHTHQRCEIKILPNLEVRILDAGYGSWYSPGFIEI